MAKYRNLRNRNTMRQINELTTLLTQHFQWNKARMDCLIRRVIALFLQGDDQPEQISASVSKYSPIRFPLSTVATIYQWCPQRWLWGCGTIYNVLGWIFRNRLWADTGTYPLAVEYKGIAIPIYWLLLNKKGNSNTRERIALLKRFIKHVGKTRIIRLLADRVVLVKSGL